MRSGVKTGSDYQKPSLIKEAKELANYIKSLSDNEIGSSMHLSKNLAKKTWYTWQSWDVKENSIPAIDAFLGDIYSGLRSNSFSNEDRLYANERLYIISGLYGILKALDNISPYRLEMAYKLPKEPYSNLYKFWGDKLVSKIPEDYFADNLFYVFVNLNDNLKSPEYFIVPSKTVAHYVKSSHQNWLGTPGKKGQQHKDTNMRQFMDKDEIYLNMWELLGL